MAMPISNVRLLFIICYDQDLLSELGRREKSAKIKPDPDIDVYMKVKRSCFLF